MKIACLTFTEAGTVLADHLQAGLSRQAWPVSIFTKADYKARLPGIFRDYDGIVFIAATGIAVRLSAPFLQDKATDPAIVVVDDLGRYAISLVSGHLGGANALAERVAAILGCQPIITTASDSRGIEAVDLFAQQHGLHIANVREAATITALMVAGQPIQFVSEIDARIHYPHLVDDGAVGAIFVTSQAHVACDLPCCLLHPKTLHVGIGCRRGKTQAEILTAITQVFERHNLSLHSIKSLATIDVKQDEPGLHAACTALGCELRIYTKQEIARIQDRFAASPLVQKKIGVSAVCEPCACLAGDDLIVGKTALVGVTVAVSRERSGGV